MCSIVIFSIRLIVNYRNSKRFHVEKKGVIYNIVASIVVLGVYFAAFASSAIAINCELAVNATTMHSFTVTEKGYIYDTARRIGFCRRLACGLENEDNIKIYISVSEDEYCRINEDDDINITKACGLFGTEYYYYSKKWEYSNRKSILVDRQFKQFIKHENLLRKVNCFFLAGFFFSLHHKQADVVDLEPVFTDFRNKLPSLLRNIFSEICSMLQSSPPFWPCLHLLSSA